MSAAVDPSDVTIREADEGDIPGIRGVFQAVYGEEYPYQGFFDDAWLKRAVFTDDIMMLVALGADGSTVIGTASVMFNVGGYSDLVGELGRLAVHPDARGLGVANLLMEARLDRIGHRIHVGMVENRAVHSRSQRVSASHGFSPVGFLPLKFEFHGRESIALFARHFGDALELRRNHPRLVPEASPLAHLVLDGSGIRPDAIVDEESEPYPADGEFDLEALGEGGLPALLRIERGRVSRREVFGPIRLQYGFFRLATKHASYLVARHRAGGEARGGIAGAIGFIRDDEEHALRVFEIVCQTERAIHFLLRALLERADREWGTVYVEVDVSGHAPRMQRTLLELGFLPAAFVPAMVFADVERLDVVKMVRIAAPLRLGEIDLIPSMEAVAEQVLAGFRRQEVLPRIAAAVRGLEVFAGLNAEQETRVAGLCRVAEFDDGVELFARGDPARDMYLVIEGEVAISLDGRRVGTVAAGEGVGEIGLITGEPRSATATAVGRVVVADLSADHLAELRRRRPDIAVRLYRNIAVGLGRKLQRTDGAAASD